MLESNTEVKTWHWWMKGWQGHGEALEHVAGVFSSRAATEEY